MDDKVTISKADAVGMVAKGLEELDAALATAYRLACELGITGLQAAEAVRIHPSVSDEAFAAHSCIVEHLGSVLQDAGWLHRELHNILQNPDLGLSEPQVKSGGGKPPKP